MVRNDAEKEKKGVQREKFSQVATSPGAQRRKKRPIEQNPAPVTRISQKSTSLIHSADTCPAKGEAPARPGTPLHRFGIHWRKMGKKGPGQNNPEKEET